MTSYPWRSIQRQASMTALCSTAVVTICFPSRRFCQQAAVTAQLSASVPQEVKKSCLASQPRASATVFRQDSTCRFISSPRGY